MSKSWEKPWSVEELVENAPSWSLAGDAGLLKHLEAFAENLFDKANETNDNLNNLLDNLDTASINLDLVKNEFLGLQNTQFIESRVYEDDETLMEAEDSAVENEVNDGEKRESLKRAVLAGIDILDKYYDRVSLPASDTDDEDDTICYVLRSKDPYISRPLPYIIGTEEWYKKTHVGLEDSSSEEEANPIGDLSDTDSESGLPVTDRREYSTSDSGTDISGHLVSQPPVANSTFNGSTDSEELDNSVPAKAPISNVNFAEQLAAHLGDVVVQSTKETTDINRRPIHKTQTHTKVIGDLFSDEPPPLDDTDDALYGNSKRGMFSDVGGGLFDDSSDEGEPFWNQKSQNSNTTKLSNQNTDSNKIPNLFDDEEDNIFKPVEKLNQQHKGLFDDEDSDGDMFSTETKPNQSKSFLKPFSTAPSFISDEPPEITTVDKKKPIGGVSIFGGKDVLSGNKIAAMLPKRRQSSSESDTSNVEDAKSAINVKSEGQNKVGLFEEEEKHDEIFSQNQGNRIPQSVDKKAEFNNKIKKTDEKRKQISLFDDEEKIIDSDSDDKVNKVSLFDGKLNKTDSSSGQKSKQVKKISLFDDTEDLFKDDLFSGIKKFSSNLFEDLEVSKGLFVENEEPKKKISLFDDDDDDDDDANIFTPKSNNYDSKDDDNPLSANKNQNMQNITSISDNENSVKSDMVFGVEIQKVHDDQITSNLDAETISEINNTEIKADIEANNLKQTKNMFNEVDDGSLFERVEVKASSQLPNFNLFQNTPPDLDDWDTKSDNAFDEDDIFDDIPAVTSNRSLFTNEPPPLEDDISPRNGETSSFKEIESETIKDVVQEEIFEKQGIGEEQKITNRQKPDIAPRKKVSLFNDDADNDRFGGKAVDVLKVNEEKETINTVTHESPKKLKHKLNINVAALMPGAAPPRKKDAALTKSQSLEESGSEVPATVIAHTRSVTNISNNDQINTLHSLTKSRARIPIKRKPSSRRARQDAMKKSQQDEENGNVDRLINQNDAGEIKNVNRNEECSYDNELPIENNGNIYAIDADFRVKNNDLFNQNANTFSENENIFGGHVKINSFKKEIDDIMKNSSSNNDIFNENVQKLDNPLGNEKITSKNDKISENNDVSKSENIFDEKSPFLSAKDDIFLKNDVLDEDNKKEAIFQNTDPLFSQNDDTLDKKREVFNENNDVVSKSENIVHENAPFLSANDDIFLKNDVLDEGNKKEDIFQNTDPLFSKNDDILDLFDETESNSKKEDENKINKTEIPRKPKTLDLFQSNLFSKAADDLFDDDNDLFASKKKPVFDTVKDDLFMKSGSLVQTDSKAVEQLGGPAKNKKPKSLFDDDDEGLFSSKTERKGLFDEAPKKMVAKKGALFDDLSDEDDMFTSGAKNVTKPNIRVAKAVKRQLLRKSEEGQVVDDPLEALK